MSADLNSREPAELLMPVQACYQERVHEVRCLRYAWAEDGTLLLALDCCPPDRSLMPLTFHQLQQELRGLCDWQKNRQVAIGFPDLIVECAAVYHAFELATNAAHSLMMVCTPPEAYFELAA